MEIKDEITQVNEPDYHYGGIYTYADYLKWTIEERLELIKGKIFRMSPAPNRMHQTLSGALFLSLAVFLKKQTCKVFAAPFDVRLPRKSIEDKDVITVVQPDICVICDKEKLDDKGCIGAPDIVVEILSPGNNAKELRNKYEVYEESGVKEYWIVSPLDKTFLVYLLEDGKYRNVAELNSEDRLTSHVLPGFELHLKELFSEI